MRTPKEIKDEIRFIIDQLEKYNYAMASNANAKRVFCRFIPSSYDNIIMSRKDFIIIHPKYEITRVDSYSFRIKERLNNLVDPFSKPNYDKLPENVTELEDSKEDEALRNRYKQMSSGALMMHTAFTLSFNDFKEISTKNCNYCGKEPLNNVVRLDNTKPFTIENCVPCCDGCMFKNRLSFIKIKGIKFGLQK